MKKTKRIAAFSMSMVFALTTVFGCTNKNHDIKGAETTVADMLEQEAPTTDAARQDITQKDDIQPEQTTAGYSREEHGGSSETPAIATSGAAQTDSKTSYDNVEFEDIEVNRALTGFLDMMEGVDAVRMTLDLNMNISNAYPGEFSLGGTGGTVKIRSEDQWDIDKMVMDGTVFFELNTGTVKFSDELLTFAIDKDETQISTTLPDLLAGLLGGTDQIDMMLKQFGGGITYEDIKSVSAFSVPVGTGVMNPLKVDESSRRFLLDYLTRILGEVDARSITGNENDITIELNGAFMGSIMRSIVKNTKDSDYAFLFKYLQENGTPAYNDSELYEAADRLAKQINKGCMEAGRGLNLTADDLVESFNRYYIEFTDDTGAQLFASEEEMERSIRAIFGATDYRFATKEEYEEAVKDCEEDLREVFKDGFPKVRIRYDDKAKAADISADFSLTDPATGEKIAMNLVMHMEKAVVSIQKIPNTVEFSEVVRVGYKLFSTFEALLGPILSMSDVNISIMD